MDPKQVKEWRAGYEALDAWSLEQKKKETPQQRFTSLTAIWRRALILGHLGPKEPDLRLVETWQRLRDDHGDR